MGNSNSSNKDSIRQNSKYDNIINHYQLNGKISINDLHVIFNNFDNSFITTLLNYYSHNDEIIENDFIDLLENFKFKTSRKFIEFLITISQISTTISPEQIKLLLNWISFSRNDEFCDIIFNSYAQLSLNKNEFDIDDFLSWIERNFSDFGTDFSRCAYRALNCENSIESTKLKCSEVINHLNSSLIKEAELFILFGCLPTIFLTSGDVEEFSFENAKHWMMLYNSDSHGLSSRKFRETSFDYSGPLLILIRTACGVYCLASDVGLKEDWNSYGGIDARLLQLRPVYRKYLSGNRSSSGTGGGIIYSHFSAKSGRRGLFVGHSPLQRPAMELDEHCTVISMLGRSEQLVQIVVWAVGACARQTVARLIDVRNWERKEVDKEQNRRLRAEKWDSNPDRDILDWGGVNVRHTDFIGGVDNDRPAE